MRLTPDKTHLTALDILLELRCCIICAVSQSKKGHAPCDYPIPMPLRKPWASYAMA